MALNLPPPPPRPQLDDSDDESSSGSPVSSPMAPSTNAPPSRPLPVAPGGASKAPAKGPPAVPSTAPPSVPKSAPPKMPAPSAPPKFPPPAKTDASPPSMPKMPANLPPPPAAMATINLPPPPTESAPPSAPGTPHSPTTPGKKSKKSDKSSEKSERRKTDKKEKKSEKKEKEKEKEKEKKKDKDGKSAPNSPHPGIDKKPSSSSLSTPSDSSSDASTKKSEEDNEELSFSATFDKSLFMFNRVKNFPALEQMEGKYRMKTGSWNDRYLVLFCDFVLYYESRGSAPPRDFDKPLGALPLERVAVKKVKDFEERMEVGGLIPKTIFYEHCFEVPLVGDDGKERIVLLQFDRAETAKAWREKIKSQAKNVDAMKGKVTPELKNQIEILMNKFPLSHRLKEAPHTGDEERWIATLKDYLNARNKQRKDLRRAQLFSDFYLPNFKAYIDWFVTSGGEAGVASLEKEFFLAEEMVVAAWKTEVTGTRSAFENDVDEVDQTNELAIRQLLAKATRRSHLIKMYNLFHKEMNPGRDIDKLEEAAADWAAFEGLLSGYIDKIQKDRIAEGERMVAEHEAAIKQAQADAAKREEERRNDPFGNGDDDDPFADVKVVGI